MIYRLEKPHSKMLEEKAYSCYLRSTSFSQIPLLQFTFLSGNDHNQENEGNPIFEPIQIFDNNEDVVNVVDQKNISDCLDNYEQFFENIDFKDDSDISSVLMEKFKSNCDDNNNGLMLFNEETVQVLGKLYESLKKQVSLDEVCNHTLIHRNKCCRVLLLPATTNIQSQLENIFKTLKIYVLAWKRNIKKVLSPYAEMITSSGMVLLMTRSPKKLMRSSKSQAGLINI